MSSISCACVDECIHCAVALQAAAADIIREQLWRGTAQSASVPAAGRGPTGVYDALVSVITSAAFGTAAVPAAAEAAVSAPASGAPAAPPSRGTYVEQRVRDCVGLPAPTASGKIVALGDSAAPRSASDPYPCESLIFAALHPDFVHLTVQVYQEFPGRCLTRHGCDSIC